VVCLRRWVALLRGAACVAGVVCLRRWVALLRKAVLRRATAVRAGPAGKSPSA